MAWSTTTQRGQNASSANAWYENVSVRPGLIKSLLIGFGIDELSVVPAVLPEIKKIIRCLNYARAQEISRDALKIGTAEEVEAHLRKFLKKEIPDLPLDGIQIT